VAPVWPLAPGGKGLAAGWSTSNFRLAESRWHQAVLVAMEIVDVWISGLEGLSSLTFMLGLDELSPIGVWDVLGGWTHDGHGTGRVLVGY